MSYWSSTEAEDEGHHYKVNFMTAATGTGSATSTGVRTRCVCVSDEADPDHDGMLGANDNCAENYNPEQADADDGILPGFFHFLLVFREKSETPKENEKNQTPAASPPSFSRAPFSGCRFAS